MTPEERQHIESQIKKLKELNTTQAIMTAMALQTQLNKQYPNKSAVITFLNIAEELLSKGGK